MKSLKIASRGHFWLGMFILAYVAAALVVWKVRGSDAAFKVVMVGTAIEAVGQTVLAFGRN